MRAGTDRASTLLLYISTSTVVSTVCLRNLASVASLRSIIESLSISSFLRRSVLRPILPKFFQKVSQADYDTDDTGKQEERTLNILGKVRQKFKAELDNSRTIGQIAQQEGSHNLQTQHEDPQTSDDLKSEVLFVHFRFQIIDI